MFCSATKRGFSFANVELVVFDEFDRLFDSTKGQFIGQVSVFFLSVLRVEHEFVVVVIIVVVVVVVVHNKILLFIVFRLAPRSKPAQTQSDTWRCSL